jgi:dUTP pyrophosphatase
MTIITEYAERTAFADDQAKDDYINMVEKWCNIISDAAGKVSVGVVYTDKYNGGADNEPLRYAYNGDSGFDLRAETNDAGGYEIAPKGTVVIPVGIKVAVPKGTELQVRTRSGSPVKKGFFVANSPGTVN